MLIMLVMDVRVEKMMHVAVVMMMMMIMTDLMRSEFQNHSLVYEGNMITYLCDDDAQLIVVMMVPKLLR